MMMDSMMVQLLAILAASLLLAGSLATDPLSQEEFTAKAKEVGQTRIINGNAAPNGRFPYTVSLKNGNFHFCGGSLIGKSTNLKF